MTLRCQPSTSYLRIKKNTWRASLKISLFCVGELAFSYGEKLDFYFKLSILQTMKSPIFNSTESPAASDNFEKLSLSGIATGSSVHSTHGGPVRDIFGVVGGGVKSHSNLGEISFVTPFARGVSVVQMFNRHGVCCTSVGSSSTSKMCFCQLHEHQCPASHRKKKIDLNLKGPTIYRVDAGSSSTALILEPKLLVTESVKSIVQSLSMYNQYTEDIWNQEVATCEG